jgi:uncharacterized membrane protein
MFNWITNSLVSDWKKAHTWISMQAMSASLVLIAVWQVVPADLKEIAPSWVSTTMLVGLLVLGILGRLWNQGMKNG